MKCVFGLVSRARKHTCTCQQWYQMYTKDDDTGTVRRARNVPKAFFFDLFVDLVFVLNVPERIMFLGLPPLENLPEGHAGAPNVDFLIVLRLACPELWRLPIDCTYNAADRSAGRLAIARKTEVVDLSRQGGGNKHVSALDITVDDHGRLKRVEVV